MGVGGPARGDTARVRDATMAAAIAAVEMSRFLLQTHAPTSGLAHLGTALAIGAELERRGEQVTIAYGGSVPELIERAGLERVDVAEVPADREWTPAQWFRSAAELEPVVASHLAAIGSVAPDVVIACHGVAGRLAAEIAGVPLIHAFHYLHTTRFARAVSVNRDRLRDLRRPRRALRVGRARLRRSRAGREGALRDAVAELRRERGLPPAPPEAVAGVPDSLVAITTAPFLVAAEGLPDNWRYVGPVHWSPPAPDPEIPPGPGPLAYVTQGSTGRGDLLERGVCELLADRFRVIATTAGLLDPAELPTAGDRLSAARLFDGGACMRAADVAIVHGGQQTLLDAVAAGTPVVALPIRSDQIGQLHRIAELGVGRSLYPPPLLPGAISRSARRVLRSPAPARSRALAAQLADGWDGGANLAELAVRLATGDLVAARSSA